MRYVDNNGSVNLTEINVQGLPTMPVGKYTGIFSGATMDDDGLQWITVTTTKSSHIEQSDLDVSEITLGSRISFEIAARNGAVALMNGNKYKLVDVGTDLTDWLQLNDLYVYIKKNKITLAEPKLVVITPVGE